jgi:serine phosphatase RsbU (regulator of sigma subunit)
LQAYLELLDEPGEVISRLNNRLVKSVETGNFMSLFLGVLDVSSRELSYVNAGHPGAWLMRGEQSIEMGMTGMAVGIMEDQAYETKGPMALQAGDLIFLCTDGLLEARNLAGDLFGGERLIAELQRAGPEADVRYVLECVLGAVSKFAGSVPAEDDWTMMAVRVT